MHNYYRLYNMTHFNDLYRIRYHKDLVSLFRCGVNVAVRSLPGKIKNPESDLLLAKQQAKILKGRRVVISSMSWKAALYYSV
jgi:hypothetical protein